MPCSSSKALASIVHRDAHQQALPHLRTPLQHRLFLKNVSSVTVKDKGDKVDPIALADGESLELSWLLLVTTLAHSSSFLLFSCVCIPPQFSA